MTGSPDLQLWLDATSEATIEKASLPGQLPENVSKWTSRDVTGRKLTAAFTDRNVTQDIKDSAYDQFPLFRPKDNNSPASIEFDFFRTMTIDRPLTDIKTVISVHKYKSTVSTSVKMGRYKYFKWVAVLLSIEKILTPHSLILFSFHLS